MERIFKSRAFRVVILTVFLLVACYGSTYAGIDDNNSNIKLHKKGFDVDFNKTSKVEYKLEFNLADYRLDTIAIDGIEYSVIKYEGNVFTNKKGYAELPYIKESVQISPDKDVKLRVIDSVYTDYKLDKPLLPSKGTIYRDQDPSKIKYEIDENSRIDKWYPEETASNSEPYIIRNVRGINVYVYPFQYNAKKNILRVYNNVKVKLMEHNASQTNILKQSYSPSSAATDAIYDSLFINYERASSTRGLSINDIDGEILVIYTSRDAGAIRPYIDWKREKGFVVTEKQVTAGTNVKQVIKDAFAANSKILYVQLVGDWEDIKSDLGTRQNAPMDPMLGCVVGTDKYPDLIVGRFSAKSATDVTTQVNKAINYEKYPELSGTWYKSGLGIGSGEGTGDDSEYDYQHIDIIKENKLVPFSYTNVTEAYGSPAKSVVKNAVNSGISIINYCGHGSTTSFVTSGYSNTDIAAATNGSKLPFIFSVACVNGKFHGSSDCFAEAWLKKQGGGAVATWMSTINQPWNPPMKGQDYANDILTGGYSYTTKPGNGIDVTEGRTTMGSIVFNAGVLMYTEDTSTDSLETLQTWTTFGDAALQLRTNTPRLITLSNAGVAQGTPFATVVTSSGSPVAGALVSLCQNGKTYSARTSSSGSVSISHSLVQGPAKLVVTGFNLETKYLDVNVGY